MSSLSSKTPLLAGLLSLLLTVSACQRQEESAAATVRVDLLIRGGLVFGGHLGDELTPNDVGVRGDRIVFVGNATAAGISGDLELNASGMIVTAGFIDPHTHSLSELRSDDQNANLNYLYQGVTTVFNGNDGGGTADIKGLSEELITNGIGTNTALFVGHGEVRREVMGGDNRPPTDDELAMMNELVRLAMQNGAIGLSTGLFYAPGSFASTEEVVALAATAAEYGGIYDTHLRDESSYTIGLLGAVEETLEIGRRANLPVHFAHIKALGVDVWQQSAQVIEAIEAAQDAGQMVTADQYPWRASGTHMRNALLPKPLLEGDRKAYLQRLADPDVVRQVVPVVRENLRRRGGAEALLIVVAPNAEIVGMTLAEVAAIREMDVVDTALDIIRDGSTRVASFNMNPDDVEAFMSRPWVMTSSDGTDGHPRKYASFPQKYREYVVNRATLSLEDFLYRSSGLAATTFSLTDRGRIESGYAADIVVIDPDAFRPLANFDEWNLLSQGVVHAIVNGKVAIHEEQFTGALAGRVLLRQRFPQAAISLPKIALPGHAP